MSYDPITGMWIDDNNQSKIENENEDVNESFKEENIVSNEEIRDQDFSSNNDSQNNYNYNYNYEETKPKNKKTKKRPFMKSVALAIILGLFAGASFQGVSIIREALIPKKTVNISTVDTSSSKSTRTSTSNTDIVSVTQNTMPSIVSITNMGLEEVQSFFFGTSVRETQSSGSGIIVGQSDEELLIVTNNHVVENSEKLTVTFVDEKSIEGDIKGTDSLNDLAIIAISLDKIEDKTIDAIKIATLGNSSDVLVGEEVIAIGNALGYGQSVTSGIISAKDRQLQDSDIKAKLIQTDAAINPGNSGGALLNSAGEVIGINVAKISSTEIESMGYAIPSDIAKPVIDELMNQKTRSKVDEDKRGKIGIKCTDVSQEASEVYGMPVGVYVSEVEKNSGASKAGLEKGDIITKIDGTTITTTKALTNRLEYYEKGESVTLTVQRISNSGKYKEKEIVIKLN